MKRINSIKSRIFRGKWKMSFSLPQESQQFCNKRIPAEYKFDGKYKFAGLKWQQNLNANFLSIQGKMCPKNSTSCFDTVWKMVFTNAHTTLFW